jgi:hypothetical protein
MLMLAHCPNRAAPLPCLVIDTSDYDRLRQAYKGAVDEWVAAIREEEALSTPDHSMVAMEHWDAACFKEQDAQERAIAAN